MFKKKVTKKEVKANPLVTEYQAGDSIQDIADRHDVTVEEVLKANDL
jgi:LysM repeat protein